MIWKLVSMTFWYVIGLLVQSQLKDVLMAFKRNPMHLTLPAADHPLIGF